MWSLNSLRELWLRSRETGLGGAAWRAKFLLAALRRPHAYALLASAPKGGLLGKLIADRPHILSFLVSPYVDARWDVETRIQAFVAHIELLEGPFRRYQFSVGEVLRICDLKSFGMEDFQIILDKPIYMFREGVLTLSIFSERFRCFSVTFCFAKVSGEICVVIGGIQGRKSDGMLDLYRTFTKQAHGFRPRDLLIEILRMLVRAEGVSKLLAIRDMARHNRHPFFSRDVQRELPLDYDEIWRDRGGQLDENGYFDIPLHADHDIDRVPARKRSMYKKRFAALDELEIEFSRSLKDAVPESVLPDWAT